MQEEKLNFGSVSSPVKIGDTVHREAGPWTPTIHALLTFLNQNGFKYSPKPIGRDEQDREVLNFLPGEAAVRPWPTALFSNEGLIQAAKMLREYHDIVKDFALPSDAEWRIGKVERKPSQIIRHGDIGPWNTLWQGDQLTGLIDWDFAEPGERITDLAQLAYYFVPLRKDGWQQAGFIEQPDLSKRLTVLCKAYDDFQPAEVVVEVLQWLNVELGRVQELGGQDREPWASFLKRGDVEELLIDIDWLKKNQRLFSL